VGSLGREPPGRRSRSYARAGRPCGRDASWHGRSRLDLQDLLFLLLAHAIDLFDPFVGQLLDPFLLPARLVAADRAIALLVLHLVRGLATVIADLDARLFHALMDDLDQVLATLLGERWDVEAHHGAVDIRHQADVALLDRLLDRAQHAPIPRLDHDLVRLG